MNDVIVLSGANMVQSLLALIVFCAGYFFKGVFFALLSELIYKRLAKLIIKKGEEWQKTHPDLLKWLEHFLDNHSGLHPNRGKCSCLQKNS